MRILKNIQLCNDQRSIDMHSVIKCLYKFINTEFKNGVLVNSMDRTTVCGRIHRWCCLGCPYLTSNKKFSDILRIYFTTLRMDWAVLINHKQKTCLGHSELTCTIVSISIGQHKLGHSALLACIPFFTTLDLPHKLEKLDTMFESSLLYIR